MTAVIDLAAISGVMAATLLLPRIFSNPDGVDPYVVRLSVAALLMVLATYRWPKLRQARVLALAMLAITLSYNIYSGLPYLLGAIGLGSLSYGAGNLVASAAETLATLAIIIFVVRQTSAAQRPGLRFDGFTWPAALTTVAGTAIFLLIFVAIPAMLLGRLVLEPVALARDAWWLIPANVLQAAAQELQFRGLLLGALDKLSPPLVANISQAVLFGLAHIAVQYQGPSVPLIPITVVLGFVLGAVTQRTRSIWPAIIIHAVADVVVTAAVIPGIYGS